MHAAHVAVLAARYQFEREGFSAGRRIAGVERLFIRDNMMLCLVIWMQRVTVQRNHFFELAGNDVYFLNGQASGARNFLLRGFAVKMDAQLHGRVKALAAACTHHARHPIRLADTIQHGPANSRYAVGLKSEALARLESANGLRES